MGVHGIAKEQLKSFIDRLENLEAEKKALADDIRDVLGDAGSVGFDKKIIRKIIAMRKKSADERAEEEAVLHTYLVSLGMRAQGDLFEEAA